MLLFLILCLVILLAIAKYDEPFVMSYKGEDHECMWRGAPPFCSPNDCPAANWSVVGFSNGLVRDGGVHGETEPHFGTLCMTGVKQLCCSPDPVPAELLTTVDGNGTVADGGGGGGGSNDTTAAILIDNANSTTG